MVKNKTNKQSAKATLAEVIKEMAKPRVATSARE
jgi:TolA-binding protein